MNHQNTVVNTLAFKPLYNYLQQRDYAVVADKVLEMAGVELDQIGSHEHQCPIENFYNAYHLAISMTGDELLGLHVGQWLHPSNMGLLGYAMLNCETIQEALYLVLSSNMHGFGNDTVEFGIEVEGNLATMTMHTEENKDWIRPWMEFTTAGWISHYNHLTNFIHQDAPLFKEVAFPFCARGNEQEYEKVLNCPVLFDQKQSYIKGDLAIFSQKILSADKNSLQMFMDKLGLSASGEKSLIDEVRMNIKKALPANITAQDMAESFGMSLSTFKRRLSQLGSSYNEISLGLKMEMAREMLRNREISINEISYYLGYSKPSAFFRLFKREQGVTPKQFRDEGS